MNALALALLAAAWLAGALYLVGRNYPLDSPVKLETYAGIALVCLLLAIGLSAAAVVLAY